MKTINLMALLALFYSAAAFASSLDQTQTNLPEVTAARQSCQQAVNLYHENQEKYNKKFWEVNALQALKQCYTSYFKEQYRQKYEKISSLIGISINEKKLQETAAEMQKNLLKGSDGIQKIFASNDLVNKKIKNALEILGYTPENPNEPGLNQISVARNDGAFFKKRLRHVLTDWRDCNRY